MSICFQEQPIYSLGHLGSLYPQIWIVCPQCQKKAIVYLHDDKTYRLYCRHCFYLQQITANEFIVNCHSCRKSFFISSLDSYLKKGFISGTCPYCQITGTYRVQLRSENNIIGINPFLKHLWLQENYKGNHFFALNGWHLQYLKDFIRADLRKKRRGNNGAYCRTYLSDLPQFIKTRKNRSGLLKIIQRLEKKAEN